MIEISKIKRKVSDHGTVVLMVVVLYILPMLGCIGLFRHINSCVPCRMDTGFTYTSETVYTFCPIGNLMAVVVGGSATAFRHMNDSNITHFLFGERP